MYDISKYEDAHTVEEAIALLQANPRAVVISGGSDVLIKIREGKLPAAELVSIRGIEELKEIKLEGDETVAIGAAATFTQLTRHPLISRRLPLLTEAAGLVGGPQIRNMGTIGGNVCNGATSADCAAPLFAFNARLRIQGPEGIRTVAIQDFYQGPGKVALGHGDILTAILIAREDYSGFSGCYIKYAMRNAMDIATLGCAAAVRLRDSRVEELRLAFSVAAPTPVRCPQTEELAKGRTVDGILLADIGRAAVSEVQPRDSWRASREFRLHLAEELSKQAVAEACRRAGHESDRESDEEGDGEGGAEK